MNKKHCSGCEDNFYNGNNPFGVKECWRLKEAKLIKRKKVSVEQEPPYKQDYGTYPDCYRIKRFAFLNKNGELK